MSSTKGVFEGRTIRMSGSYGLPDLRPKCAIVEEGINRLTTMTLDFLSRDRALNLGKVVGSTMTLEIDTKTEGETRSFSGICTSARFMGTYQGFGLYQAEISASLWFLTRAKDCRVFQEKTAPDIIKQVLGDHGLSANIVDRLSDNYAVRAFTLQYRETDLDFLCRLMEEEGIYYYFTHENGEEKIVLADSVGAHRPTPGASTIPYFPRETEFRRDREHIYEWAAAEGATTGKVTLSDYNFLTPRERIVSTKSMERGSHANSDKEVYDAKGHFRVEDVGARHARVRMEAEAIRHQKCRGVANIPTLGVGQTFRVTDLPGGRDGEYMITRATHYFHLEMPPDLGGGQPALGMGLDFAIDPGDLYRCVFEVVPKKDTYRAPQLTPWPEIASIQTATVVGPGDQEIHTDKYGRIRIQFHWDRVGEYNEKSSVWVRVMTPWAGKNWGMVAIPRIGQEVIVQFEDGNPDRPIVTGMLYNGDNLPPWNLPANHTQTGIRTNSSQGGEGYNELMFEDKKGNELVNFQAQKDYNQIVKNNAKVSVGTESKDAGDMTVTVHRHLTETVETGNHKFKVDAGTQTLFVKSDKTETVEGKSALTVTKDTSATIKEGNLSTTVEMGDVSSEVGMGNVSERVKMGNHDTVLDMGNLTIDVKLGMVEIKAMQEIKLTVGTNSIVIGPAGITMKGLMVTAEAQAMLEIKAPLTQVKGDALLTVKGGLTMIN